jgi:hypothetical protein
MVQLEGLIGKSNDLIRNQPPPPPTCRILPQPTTLPHASTFTIFYFGKFKDTTGAVPVTFKMSLHMKDSEPDMSWLNQLQAQTHVHTCCYDSEPADILFYCEVDC